MESLTINEDVNKTRRHSNIETLMVSTPVESNRDGRRWSFHDVLNDKMEQERKLSNENTSSSGDISSSEALSTLRDQKTTPRLKDLKIFKRSISEEKIPEGKKRI